MSATVGGGMSATVGEMSARGGGGGECPRQWGEMSATVGEMSATVGEMGFDLYVEHIVPVWTTSVGHHYDNLFN